MHLFHVRYLKRLVACTALCLAVPVGFAQTPAPATPAPASAATAAAPIADDGSSYSIGLSYGHQLRNSGLEHSLSTGAVERGLREGLAGKAVSPKDQESATQLLRLGRDWLAVRNRAAAKEFLTKNATASGVTTTASGLQYQVFAPGDTNAASPGTNDRVTVHYVARLLDGTEFDNSESHGDQPTTFSLSGVIKGWHEALTMMKPGAKWRVFIPPALAFDSNSPVAVPPGSLIIADLELVKIDAAPVVRRMEINTPPALAVK